MTFPQFTLAVRARWKTLAYVLGGTVTLALILSLVLPKMYMATTSLVVDVNSPDPVTQAQLPAQLSTSYLATQIDIIESPRVAQRVSQLLHLQQMPEMQQRWRDETNGRGDFDVWMGDRLDKYLEVVPSKDSNVISVSFLAGTSALAAQVANTFAQVYMDTNAELVADPAKNYSTWFETRTKSLRQAVMDAQSRLSDFQRAHGIVGSDDQTDVETNRLNELSQQLVNAQGMQADSTARQGQPNVSPDELPEVVQNPLITGLKTQIAMQEAVVQQDAGRLGTNHPTYIDAVNNLQALRAREAAEVRRIVGSLGSADRTGRVRVADLRAQVEAQKAKVLQLRATRDQSSVLQRDVDTAQRNYDAVTQRLAQSSLESQMQQTNVSVLTPAVAPLFAARPRLLLNVAIAILLGGILGVGAVLWQEMTDQRVRSPEQLALIGGVAVLGIVPGRGGNRRGDLWLPASRGALPALEWK